MHHHVDLYKVIKNKRLYQRLAILLMNNNKSTQYPYITTADDDNNITQHKIDLYTLWKTVSLLNGIHNMTYQYYECLCITYTIPSINIQYITDNIIRQINIIYHDYCLLFEQTYNELLKYNKPETHIHSNEIHSDLSDYELQVIEQGLLQYNNSIAKILNDANYEHKLIYRNYDSLKSIVTHRIRPYTTIANVDSVDNNNTD